MYALLERPEVGVSTIITKSYFLASPPSTVLGSNNFDLSCKRSISLFNSSICCFAAGSELFSNNSIFFLTEFTAFALYGRLISSTPGTWMNEFGISSSIDASTFLSGYAPFNAEVIPITQPTASPSGEQCPTTKIFLFLGSCNSLTIVSTASLIFLTSPKPFLLPSTSKIVSKTCFGENFG